jgi:hypothetical protein
MLRGALQRLTVQVRVQSRGSSTTIDDVLKRIDGLANRVDGLAKRVDGLDTKLTDGLADVRSLIGGVHETALRADLRIQRGHAFSESFLVTNALSIVRLAAPSGLLLPSEHGLQFADRGQRVADVAYLELDRATRLAGEIYVSHGCIRVTVTGPRRQDVHTTPITSSSIRDLCCSACDLCSQPPAPNSTLSSSTSGLPERRPAGSTRRAWQLGLRRTRPTGPASTRARAERREASRSVFALSLFTLA